MRKNNRQMIRVIHHYRKTASPKLRVYTIVEISETRSETSTRYKYHRVFRIAAKNPDGAWDVFYSRAREIPGMIYKLTYNPLPNKALTCPVIEL